MTAPLRSVWDALERSGCQPHGVPHDFRARCPAHGGDNPEALHVFVGADGSARLWCFAHRCEAEAITHALGLEMGDLYPAGHHRARRQRLTRARRADFTGNARTAASVLAALQRLGADWEVSLKTDCPRCGSPQALLVASPRHVFVSCPNDDYAQDLGYAPCTLEQYEQALAGRVEDLDHHRKEDR